MIHARTRNHTITSIVEKGLTGRPAAKQSASEALLLYIELDKADPVIEELLPLLAHKQPKIIAATLSALTTIFHAYGCKTVEPKPVIKILPKAYGHADKNVRAEAQSLTVELYRWLKDAMKPLFWGDLKPVQQQDLEKLFEKVKDEPPPKQERLLRSQQEAQASAVESSQQDGEAVDGDEAEPEIDLEPEVMAVDVFAKVPKDFQDRLASTKWSDRKEALDDLFTAVNVPAIEEGPFDDLLRGCAKSMKDANIAVVTVAANCVECIAKGLRRKFSKYRSTILSPMLERFKEKKQSVTDALAAACDAVFAATGLSDVLEEVLEFLKHKNPQVKLQTTLFLVRGLKSTREVPQPPEVKAMAEAATKLLSESQETQRTAGAEVLGVLWKIMGDRNMLMHIEGLDEIKKNKVKEFCEQAEVKAKWKPAAAPPKAAPAPAAGTKKSAPGTKRPAAKKAAPPAQREAWVMDDGPPPPVAPLAARPTSRPVGKLPPPKGLPAPAAGGLKKPGLARPGVAAPGSLMSPKRPTAQAGEDTPPTPQPRGLPTPGRGLAARPLGKPVSEVPSLDFGSTTSQGPSALSQAERSELSDLRSEVELLRQQNSDLRTDKLRQQSQIHELQNQNAQLIEDHTRDVLSVKAKETQLVRARSDVDAAEEQITSLSREVDRLKRDVQRMGRDGGNTGRDSPASNDYGPRSNGLNGMASSYSGLGRPSVYTSTKSQTNTLPRANSSYANSQQQQQQQQQLDQSSMQEDQGKENVPEDCHGSSSPDEKNHKLIPSGIAVDGNAPSEGQQDQGHSGAGTGSSSRAMPPPSLGTYAKGTSLVGLQRAATGDAAGGGGTAASGIGNGSTSMASSRTSSLNRSQSDGVESWKRAAEVTQNLKARIEMMKVR